MLLRRIKHHVVVGVYVGIEVSNWNDARQDDARAQYFLERIRHDLTIDRAQATDKQRFWSRVSDDNLGRTAEAHL